MQIQILYFGLLADRIGLAAETFEWKSGQRVEELRKQLLERYPFLAGQKFKIAVNQQIASEEMEVPFPAEIACLPPFAGG